MIILDTNVVSELQRSAPDPHVAAWLASHPRSELFLSAITIAELRFGIAILPVGRRRDGLTASIDTLIQRPFAGRVLAFDTDCAGPFALISATRRALGRPIAHADAQIAAIARRHGALLATRNTKDFQDCGMDVINPWEPT